MRTEGKQILGVAKPFLSCCRAHPAGIAADPKIYPHTGQRGEKRLATLLRVPTKGT